MDNIKHIKKDWLAIKDLKYVIKKNKLNNDIFDVSFYNKSNWKPISWLKISKVNKTDIHNVDKYISYLIENELFLTDFWFKDYLKSINNKTYSHFFSSIIDQAYLTEARLTPVLEKLNNDIQWYYNKITKLSEEQNIRSSSNIFTIEYISDDIYWTTTMEGEIVDKEYIEKILVDKNFSWTNLSELEATNIRNGFFWAIKKSIDSPKLSINLIKEAHKVSTKDLDKLVIKWLKYYSGKFRNEVVNMWIFRTVNWKIDYFPPEKPDEYINELCEYFNKWSFNLVKLSNLHLILYSLHPFYNWNKRTTRVIETLYIQANYDKWHYFKWMWYWFKKNIKTYMKNVRDVLSWKKTLKQWNQYYINSFLDMCEYSLYEITNLKKDIKKVIEPTRVRYYDDKDQIFYRFYLNNKDTLFSIKELFNYLNANWIRYSEMNQLNKRISKHQRDNIIEKTDLKKWKMALYKLNILYI